MKFGCSVKDGYVCNMRYIICVRYVLVSTVDYMIFIYDDAMYKHMYNSTKQKIQYPVLRKHAKGWLPRNNGSSPLTRWPLVYVAVVLKTQFSCELNGISTWILAVILLSKECHRTSRMKSSYCFRSWHDTITKEAIICANFDPVKCRKMTWLGHYMLLCKSGKLFCDILYRWQPTTLTGERWLAICGDFV